MSCLFLLMASSLLYPRLALKSKHHAHVLVIQPPHQQTLFILHSIASDMRSKYDEPEQSMSGGVARMAEWRAGKLQAGIYTAFRPWLAAGKGKPRQPFRNWLVHVVPLMVAEWSWWLRARESGASLRGGSSGCYHGRSRRSDIVPVDFCAPEALVWTVKYAEALAF